MNLEQLDGFLAAIVCHPAESPKAEYLPEIWGDEMINEDTFAAQPMLQGFLSLMARHKDAVAHTLQSGDVFTPVLLADADGAFRANDWANGFLRGMELRREDWFVLFNNENHGGSLVPIFALAHEHDPDPEIRQCRAKREADYRHCGRGDEHLQVFSDPSHRNGNARRFRQLYLPTLLTENRSQ